MSAKFHTRMCLGVVVVFGLAMGQARVEAQGIRGCANPAGQFRVIGDTESCRTQETLIVAGADGGVTGGADSGPSPENGPAALSSTPTTLTTDNNVTGFPAYMVWANIAVEFKSGDPLAGTLPSPTSANCAIVYTVAGRPGTFRVDGRSVAFPVVALGSNRMVRLNIGLNGIAGSDLSPPLTAADTLDFSLNCGSNAGPTPPQNQIPVFAVSYSLSGIGISRSFGQ